MSEKLHKVVVHKYFSGTQYKSLTIIIEDGDNGFCETRYSQWSEGKPQPKKKDTDKSRLVVKIVTGEEFNGLALDTCAKVVGDTENNFNISRNVGVLDVSQNFAHNVGAMSNKGFYQPGSNYTCKDYKNFNSEERGRNVLTFLNQSLRYQQDIVQTNTAYSMVNTMTPLEYSLEKVKENNARIMENIHMLNRTLSYTKNKEILGVVCPKATRYSCNTCGKDFVYETGLKRHHSMRHALNELQPRWQVVWTCIECFQVWPQQDLASNHSNDCCQTHNGDCLREIKTSSLLQCEFCEKVFTSIPRLLRHSKMHNTAKNYECNACKSSFASYKAAEQHWLLCPWLKICYSFALPKMLLCNQCDRKFKNYEQLYNHRYKVGHFMMKNHSTKGIAKALSLLVYQCEICAQWFPNVLQLQVHRSQHHSSYDNGMLNQIDNNSCTEYDVDHFQAKTNESKYPVMNELPNLD